MTPRSPLGRPLVAAAAVEGGYDDGGQAIAGALDRLFRMSGWQFDGAPFGAVIPENARVLIKPNWVSHANQGDGGFEPLVTHGAVVRAVTEAVLQGPVGQVTVGDAPLQSCDFPVLLRASALPTWAEELAANEPRFRGIRDFRRTRSSVVDGVRNAAENQRSLDEFVLFDLGNNSLLEPVTRPGRFRVTQYDPTLMERTHAPGRHQYLVARDVIDADVLINLPKLKTHKKAGVTCALKNLIGINGNKEFLPHHRIGGSSDGGDCYPGRHPVKRLVEGFLDRQHRSRSMRSARWWHLASETLSRVARASGDELGVEGSWSGNDTIWRTCLDLNRILIYGRLDGTLADVPQRRVLHVVDAVVAGQGDGPLSPDPLHLGLLLAGSNAAAVDRVGSLLLGYEPERIPITRHSFDSFRWPIVDFPPGEVALVGDLGSGGAAGLLHGRMGPVNHPVGWRDAASLSPA